MGLSQNVYRFVILRNEVTKDLSFEVLGKPSGKDPSLTLRMKNHLETDCFD